MAVPKLAFVSVESFVESCADHVFDTDDAGIGLGAVVNEALANIFRGAAPGQPSLDSGGIRSSDFGIPSFK